MTVEFVPLSLAQYFEIEVAVDEIPAKFPFL